MIAGTPFFVTAQVAKNGVPAMIAWSLDGPGALPPPAGFTEVCRTDNECTTIDGVIELDETPVRLLP